MESQDSGAQGASKSQPCHWPVLPDRLGTLCRLPVHTRSSVTLSARNKLSNPAAGKAKPTYRVLYHMPTFLFLAIPLDSSFHIPPWSRSVTRRLPASRANPGSASYRGLPSLRYSNCKSRMSMKSHLLLTHYKPSTRVPCNDLPTLACLPSTSRLMISS